MKYVYLLKETHIYKTEIEIPDDTTNTFDPEILNDLWEKVLSDKQKYLSTVDYDEEVYEK